jgi:hypothetical protein
MNKVPTKTKEQQALWDQINNMLNPQGQLGQGYNQGINYQMDLMNPNSNAVNQFAQPYMDQFNQQTVPGLAERFAGMGGMGGGLSSSGFGQSLSAAGGNLQNQLAQLKSGLGQQAANNLMSQYSGMMNSALNYQPYAYQQQSPGMAEGLAQSWAQAGMPGLQQVSSGMQSGYNSLYNKMFPINPAMAVTSLAGGK